MLQTKKLNWKGNKNATLEQLIKEIYKFNLIIYMRVYTIITHAKWFMLHIHFQFFYINDAHRFMKGISDMHSFTCM